jgi:hypothetical protein
VGGPGRQTDTNFVHINCPGIRFSCGTPSLPGSGTEFLYDLFNGEPKGEGPGRQTDTNFVHINCPGIRFSCGTPSLPGGGARKPYGDVFCSH